MNPLRELAELPAQTQVRIDEICERFESSWQTGELPSLEDTACNLEGNLRTVLLRELLQIERHYRTLTLGRPVADEELIQSHGNIAAEVACELAQLQHSDTLAARDPNQRASSHDTLFDQFPAEFGRYRVLRALGSGGMGSVFLAQDTKLERQVALKLPHLTVSSSTQLISRFYQEAKAAATINHPNLCSVYDVGEVQGRHYLSMEYIEGEPLSSRIKSASPMPESEIAGLIRKLASALGEAHSKGVVHRDLKPSNVMVNHRDEPIVTDFGLAQRNDPIDARLTQSGEILGTPAYMSPEQVDGRLDKVGSPTDIYSLGVIMYELLSGNQPFRGSTASVLGQIMMVEPPAISETRPDVDSVLEAICRKMMARKMEDRFASMQDVSDTLFAWTQSCEVKSQPQRSIIAPRIAKGLVAASASALLLFGIVLLLRTPEATFRVEVNDPRVRVVVDDKTLKLNDGAWKGKQHVGEHRLAIAIGDQRLPLDETTTIELDGKAQKVRVSIDGLELAGDRFELARDGENSATIEVVLSNAVEPQATGTSAADLLASGEWEWRVEKNLGSPINSPHVEQSADMTADGLTIVFSRRDDSTFGYDLWMATRSSRDQPWNDPVNLGANVNTEGFETTPVLSDDGLNLSFNRKEGTAYSARKSATGSWSKAVPFPVLIKERLSQIELSSDELTLLATKNMGSNGGRDLMIARRPSRRADWGPLFSIGEPVNTDKFEDFGTLSADGRLLIFQRIEFIENESFQTSILMSTRTGWDAPWSDPVPVFADPHVGDQAPRLLPDGKTLFFASARSAGKQGFNDLWIAKLVRKN